jgi:deoxyribodipyrimidine photo-lyase
MIQSTRIRTLNARDVRKGDYVLYWMQASQRAECNHALEHAVRRANELRLPIVVFFGLTDGFPEANERHYAFMLEGLAEVNAALERKGIRFVVRHIAPDEGAAALAERAALVVTDRGYLRIQKSWRASAAAKMGCPLVQVETDAVVPVEEASPKQEYAAATFRPKIRRKLEEYLVPLKERRPVKNSLSLEIESLDIADTAGLLAGLEIARDVKKTDAFRGGTSEARKKLQIFFKDRIDHFRDLRNNPALDYLSHLSPYLHFGQISPLFVALKVTETGSPGAEAFLEELIVRRELSLNFVHYTPRYDEFEEAVPAWARKTLEAHSGDHRPVLYPCADLEHGRTHDPYWNAAQLEMVRTGKMHGYMRMYWGKKILEWSASPEDAFRTALFLNNKCELDGRDPNGFTGVAWCFGRHDRPWQTRPIFGSVRYMNDRGLCRKFDADLYVKKVGLLGS